MSTADAGARCHVCDSIRDADPDSVVLADKHWSGGIAGDVPGWVRVQTNRHGHWFWDLTPEEATSFGPTVQRLSDAIRAACDAETVYLIALGENTLHPHFLLMPRRADVPPEARGPAMLAKAAELADQDAARRTAAAIREQLA
jgi:diadenosine tetraphosphate (Ap4A) HIT family hydrolase